MFETVLITSGPTIEPIDPVRFLSNRSSGKTGYHLAQKARDRGIGNVIFITGPTCFYPADVQLIRIETAQEMRREVLRYADQAEAIIMAAAVSDFRNSKYYPEKIKKGKDPLTLKLIGNEDILRELGRKKKGNQILIGFAAETENIFENAMRKLEEKNLDLLVLNEISDRNPAFGEDENQVYLITRTAVLKMERMNKAKIADRIWDEIDRIAGKKGR
jgi:phosphopantothenoylcysteine decarboxylase/phosphopantothenate--cysteine ligase